MSTTTTTYQPPELETAKAACEAAKWPEQHRDDCAWCAYLVRVDQAEVDRRERRRAKEIDRERRASEERLYG